MNQFQTLLFLKVFKSLLVYNEIQHRKVVLTFSKVLTTDKWCLLWFKPVEFRGVVTCQYVMWPGTTPTNNWRGHTGWYASRIKEKDAVTQYEKVTPSNNIKIRLKTRAKCQGEVFWISCWYTKQPRLKLASWSCCRCARIAFFCARASPFLSGEPLFFPHPAPVSASPPLLLKKFALGVNLPS